MRVALVYIWCLFTASLVAQDKMLDVVDKDTSTVDSLNQLGYDLWIRDPSRSVQLGNRAYTMATALKYESGSAFAKRVSGVGHWSLGEAKQALFDLYEGLDLYEDLNDLEGVSNIKLNIGMVYADIDEDSLALKQFHEAINGFSQLNLDDRTATAYTKLGTLQMESGRLDKAHTNITNALNIHTRMDYKYGMSEAHNRLGRIYLEQGDLEQADYHLRQSLTIGRRIDDKDGMVSNLLQFGRMFSLQKDYEMADMHFKLALSRADQMNLNNYKLDILKNLAELKHLTQQNDSALIYYKQYVNLKDSLFTIKKSRQIAGLEFRNEILQKDQELNALSKSQKLNRTILWILIGGICIVLLLSFFLMKNIRQRTKHQKQLLEQQKIIAEQALENQQLRSTDLEGELDAKNRKLTSYAMNFVQKNQLIEDFKDKIQQAKKSTSPEKTKQILTDIERTLKINQGKEKDWEDFKEHFENVHPDFFTNLKQQYPDLSSNDLKVAALTRLNLSIKEASNILGISPESTKTARYRLRKKMDLPQETDLFDFLIQLDN
ncbi:tetratricopeptide repeat protein [Muricauda oceani]|uniref:Tetratricopeptide repeat protein n=1 Tax=Flagellimonas oceani TaxID=2698672 RepID=A0A6G7J053_9FLAO|nr:tetratricopeptide repeat protein [Allomuricauda oceani]MBW8243601.1 tetratricopeptide repeat protein [Allomuricauda oceani]QII44030.1 tetratricopeptide repeat protein [Allomuricauda oceani]